MTIRTVGVLAALVLSAVSGCGDGASEPESVDSVAVESAVSVIEPAVTPEPAATSGDDRADEDGPPETDEFPDIVEATATFDETSGTWTFAVTVSSPYDTPERYADGWRVLGPDGTVFGVHTLTHDHANEQPFTRRQSGVVIPDDVSEVTIEGRDQANGFGGSTVTIELVGD